MSRVFGLWHHWLELHPFESHKDSLFTAISLCFRFSLNHMGSVNFLLTIAIGVPESLIFY